MKKLIYILALGLLIGCANEQERILEERCGMVEYSNYDDVLQVYLTKVNYDSEGNSFDVVWLENEAEAGTFICNTF